jgi:hypothetical protein
LEVKKPLPRKGLKGREGSFRLRRLAGSLGRKATLEVLLTESL